MRRANNVRVTYANNIRRVVSQAERRLGSFYSFLRRKTFFSNFRRDGTTFKHGFFRDFVENFSHVNRYFTLVNGRSIRVFRGRLIRRIAFNFRRVMTYRIRAGLGSFFLNRLCNTRRRIVILRGVTFGVRVVVSNGRFAQRIFYSRYNDYSRVDARHALSVNEGRDQHGTQQRVTNNRWNVCPTLAGNVTGRDSYLILACLSSGSKVNSRYNRYASHVTNQAANETVGLRP